jgi:hypothetical protein
MTAIDGRKNAQKAQKPQGESPFIFVLSAPFCGHQFCFIYFSRVGADN